MNIGLGLPIDDPDVLLDRLSAGRFTLGLGLGGRRDDLAAAGVEPSGLGARLDSQLDELHAQFAGERGIGPTPATPNGPEILLGPSRTGARPGGNGFLCAAPPSWVEGLVEIVGRTWADAGRAGQPRIVGQVNVARV